GVATSATQISTLLNDQLFLVSAIGEHQYIIGKLQEQLQQNLAKLMQDLSQEVNAVHYRAQMDHAPVQNEFLLALQMRAQVAEERLRHEHLQLIQSQAAEIGLLEANIDPVIKDMVVRNGTEFAIGFINRQLQDLSLMAAAESAAPQPPAVVASAGHTAAQATSIGGDALIANEEVVVRKDPAAGAAAGSMSELGSAAISEEKAALVAETGVAALADTLEQVDLAATDAPAALPAVPAKDDGAKSTPARAPATVAKGGKSRSQSKASETVGPAKPASAWGVAKPASKDASASSEPTIAAANTAISTPALDYAPAAASESGSHKAPSKATAATPAPWSNGAAAKGKQPKKSLLQIQQEEEEALRKRQQADDQQRVSTAAARGFGPSYADRLGSAASVAPRSLAAIMAEQSKESSRSSSAVSVASAQVADDSASSASGWTVARVIASQSSPAPTPPATPAAGPAWGGANAPGSVPTSNGELSTLLGAKPAAGRPTVAKTTGSSSSGPVLPSIAFLEWCYSRLSSLRGIDVNKFIEMLLTFPLKAPESTLEIITEQVYAYSTTLNGRAFAEDFVVRRAKDHAAVLKGSAKSAPANWALVLEASSKQAASGSPASSSYGPSAPSASSHASSRIRSTSTAGSSFQVVGKKGKK
ncbi:kinesin-like protein, partial [Coemansia sp. RSA 2681]